jgi:glyoxylate reductase
VVPGEGGGSGTAADPYKGLVEAEPHARPGDLFLLHAGSYAGLFTARKSGEPGRPIVWRGAGDGETIIDGKWSHFRPMAHLGFELRGKTLGIFGLGRIGLAMAKRCRGAYGMPVLYTNRNPNAEAERTVQAKKVSFDELLQQSDIVSVHCALSDETRGIFNKNTFSKMKPSAIFINTSRGPVHNEGDLIDALQSGIIWGAGLDVTNPEPMKRDSPLLQMENVAILPHIGSATLEARSEMSRMAATNIIEFYRGNKIPNCINPEVVG